MKFHNTSCIRAKKVRAGYHTFLRHVRGIQFLGNGIRLWYSLVCVCGRLENPLEHKHPLLHYVANEKKVFSTRKILNAHDLCVLPCQRAISQ